MSIIERNDANRVARHHPEILVLVIQAESKHATEVFQKVCAVLEIKRQNNFTIRLGAKRIPPGKGIPDRLMVVYLAIHRQCLAATFTEDGLGAGINVDNGQPLMRQHGIVSRVYTTPVGAAVTQQTRLPQSHFPDHFQVLAYLKYAKYRAH